MDNAQPFYLQNAQSLTGTNVMWWKTGGGYTSDLAEAKMFTREAATRQNGCRQQDIPWPQTYIEKHTFPAVDFQYVNAEHQGATAGSSYYIQIARNFVGNDMVWLNGQEHTSNVSKAQAFSYEQATQLCATSRQYIAWSCDYIDAKTRLVVSAKHLNRAKVKAQHEYEVPKAPRSDSLRERYTCHGCRKFMSADQFWLGNCSRCGADSRP